MKKGICYVVGAGENYGLDFEPEKEDFVIAADAGLRYLEEIGIAADLIVGDFDTLQYIPQRENVLELPAEKDDTDVSHLLRDRRPHRSYDRESADAGVFIGAGNAGISV